MGAERGGSATPQEEPSPLLVSNVVVRPYRVYSLSAEHKTQSPVLLLFPESSNLGTQGW